ncbi:hypothetical protein E8E13_007425 [Curvularia kusanoi]|uniref:Uncharacterized protein n=1 Tax=Curvularia kusanoi TaxID=90978 RepID=A0A9P4WDH3_CURKU|nr:hypothetical protein E8E13_007425 [Curvularia kusanoi]
MSLPPAQSNPNPQPDVSDKSSPQIVTPILRTAPRLLIPSITSSATEPICSPGSPRTIRFPYSPISPGSPINPFLIPPQPRLITTALFRHASPLLPASPLSIFDRAISPTSLGSPDRHCRFQYTAASNRVENDTHGILTPTFLQPRTPPEVPQRTRPILSLARPDLKGETSSKDYSTGTNSSLDPSATRKVDSVFSISTKTRRLRLKVEIYYLLAARRAAAKDQVSSSPSTQSSNNRSVMKSLKKLVSKNEVERRKIVSGRCSRLGLWGGGSG